MTEPEFWKLINEAGADVETIDDMVEQLRETLEGMSRQHVIAFQKALNLVMAEAYTWDLIAAACILGCGQSDDGFEDFRGWLIARGETTFRSVLHDVRKLADIPFDQSPTEEWHCEDLHLLPGEVGGEEDDADWPYPTEPEQPHGLEIPLTKSQLRARFPELWKVFGDKFMIGIE